MRKIIARFEVPSINHERFKELFKMLISETRKEPGCLRYDLFQSLENPNLFIVDEEYKDKESIEFHRNTAHFQRIVPEVVLLASKREVETY